MDERDFLDMCIRITMVFFTKKQDRYQRARQSDDEASRRRLHWECRRAKLELIGLRQERKKLGGATRGQTD
jgi:hypothetical protein